MPFTPFHFGPGAALHALAPRHVSFLAFCAANVVIDVEPLVLMIMDRYPIHAFMHTLPGAALGAAVTVAVFALAWRVAVPLRLPNTFGWQDLELPPVIAGSVLGALSQVALDGLMHADMRPLAPFSNANPWLGAVSLQTLHVSCVAAGVVGLVLLGARALWRRSHPRRPSS